MKWLGFGLVALLASTTWGQLGKAPDQCDRLYGAAIVQRHGSQFWSQENEYRTNGVVITIRFITLSTDAKIAGWVQIAPADPGKTPLAAAPWLAKVGEPWSPVRETQLEAGATEHTKLITDAHNKHIAQVRDILRKIAGAEITHGWMSPTAYAAESRTGLTLFSDRYRERWEAANTNTK